MRSSIEFSPYRVLAGVTTLCVAPLLLPLLLFIALTCSWEDTVPAREDL